MESKTKKQSSHKDRVKARNQRRMIIETPKLTPSKSDVQPAVATRSLQDQNTRAELLTSKRNLEKNQRKSRAGKGRGMPKKGGAGGKGTWGKPGEMDLYDQVSFDKDDPNYDSETEDKDVKVFGYDVLLTADEAKPVIRNIVKEYFDHADTDDVADSALELNISGNLFYLFAKEAIYLAFDTSSDSNLELVSVLISDLYGYSVLLTSDIELAFEEFLAEIEDISLDCPEAPTILGKFIARCVADDCLPPKYIEAHPKMDSSAKATEVLSTAHNLITMKHGLIMLDNIWNAGDYRKPVKYLVKKIKKMLAEYQNSLDFQNFTHTLHELGIPHFHHEIVYEITVKCLEESSKATTCAIQSKENETIETYFKLLTDLTKSNIVTVTQFDNGLKRVYEEIVDLAIDIPGAFKSLEAFCERCQNELSVLDPALHDQLKLDAEKALKEQELGSLVYERKDGVTAEASA